jgi:ribosomal protein S15P/S13E
MSIDVYWDNDEKTIIRQDFAGNWTKDDYFAAIDESYKMSETVNHPVDTIIDMRNNTTNPIQLMNIFSTANKLESHVSDNQRAVVIVGANVTIEFALRMAKRIAKRAAENSHTARTLEEAYDIIAKQ